MKENLKKGIIIFLFLFLALFDAYSYASTIQSEIAEHVIRLHVIANSDDNIDQDLKLKVRDAILSFMKEKDFQDYDNAFHAIHSSLPQIKQIAIDTLASHGCTDTVTVEVGDFFFPFKTYDTLSFPAGIYHALRIKIGEAKGHNWWCVMYPALCFTENTCDIQDTALDLQDMLSKDAFHIIAGNYRFKLKIVEFFQELSH